MTIATRDSLYMNTRRSLFSRTSLNLWFTVDLASCVKLLSWFRWQKKAVHLTLITALYVPRFNEVERPFHIVSCGQINSWSLGMLTEIMVCKLFILPVCISFLFACTGLVNYQGIAPCSCSLRLSKTFYNWNTCYAANCR